jgi:hypothetical protein
MRLQVFDRLQSLFMGFVDSGTLPIVFVLMGNFTSRVFGSGNEELLKLKGLFQFE